MLLAGRSGGRFTVPANGDRLITTFALPGRAGFARESVGPETKSGVGRPWRGER